MVQITRICSRPLTKKFRIIFAVLNIATLMVMFAPAAFADIDRGTGVDQYVAARIAEFENRSAEALATYKILFKTEPASAAIAERLYQNAMLEGDMASAIQAVRALELQNETDATAPLLLFAHAFRRNDWQGAEIAVLELEAKSNFGFIAPILHAWVRVAQRKPHGFSRATANKNPLLSYYSEDQLVYFELAAANVAAAKPLLNRFRNIDDDFGRNLILRAAPILAANGETEFARNSLTNIIEPEFAEGLLTPGKSYTSRLQPHEGIAALFTRFAEALVQQNSPEQALTMARIANWLDDRNVPAQLALSKSLYAMNRGDAGYVLLNKISPSSPYAPEVTEQKIRRLSNTGSGRDALHLAQADMRRHPNSTRAALLLAQARDRQGHTAEAAEGYQSLIMLAEKANESPRRRAYYSLYWATMTDRNGNWNQARQILDSANILDPNNADILNYLGFTLLERREDISYALELLKRAHQLAPESAAIADSLGWGYYLNGKYAQSVLLLEKAVKLVGDDVTINEHLGDAYWQYGKRVDARYAWNTAANKASEVDKLRLRKKIEFGQLSIDPAAAQTP